MGDYRSFIFNNDGVYGEKMKILIFVLFIIGILIMGCTEEPQQPQTQKIQGCIAPSYYESQEANLNGKYI